VITGRVKPKYTEKYLRLYHFIHQKSKID
jgi:hypothetical protein